MNNTLKRLQDNMMAAAFAEAGEWDTAREMAPESELNAKLTWFDKIFMAVAFAEAGLPDEAVRMTEFKAAPRVKASILDELGLSGVRMTYGTVTV